MIVAKDLYISSYVLLFSNNIFIWGDKMVIKAMLKKNLIKQLKALQYPTGLFAASKITVSTGYNKAWLRDNIYESLAFEHIQDIGSLKKTYAALFDILLKHEYKIDYAINHKPTHAYQYIHARYDPFNYTEFHEEWGNKQNDAVGAFLFKVADLLNQEIRIIRDKNDLRILQKLVYYLGSIEYWHDKDHGIWENYEEVHASSVGACVAGLKAISKYVEVPQYLVDNGLQILADLLPNESATKHTDLALLSLIYPYNIVTSAQRIAILTNIEKYLVKEKGVIRYFGDPYYSNGLEAEWTMGFPWLAKIYKDLGNVSKFKYYTNLTKNSMNRQGELPELYYGNTNTHNENSPLGWSNAMALVAMS